MELLFLFVPSGACSFRQKEGDSFFLGKHVRFPYVRSLFMGVVLAEADKLRWGACKVLDRGIMVFQILSLVRITRLWAVDVV